jgi:hypothetical protein
VTANACPYGGQLTAFVEIAGSKVFSSAFTSRIKSFVTI